MAGREREDEAFQRLKNFKGPAGPSPDKLHEMRSGGGGRRDRRSSSSSSPASASSSRSSSHGPPRHSQPHRGGDGPARALFGANNGSSGGGGGGGGSSSSSNSGGGSSSFGAPAVPQSGHSMLTTPWVLFHKKKQGFQSRRGDDESLARITVCASAEHLWSCISHLRLPSQLEDDTHYFFFRQGIQPTWEDRSNEHGGKWIISVNPSCPFPGLLDQLWIKILAMMVGETLVMSKEICGAVVSRSSGSKSSRIAVWNKSCTDSKETLGIAKGILQTTDLLKVKEHVRCEYYTHQADDTDRGRFTFADAESSLTNQFLHGIEIPTKTAETPASVANSSAAVAHEAATEGGAATTTTTTTTATASAAESTASVADPTPS